MAEVGEEEPRTAPLKGATSARRRSSDYRLRVVGAGEQPVIEAMTAARGLEQRTGADRLKAAADRALELGMRRIHVLAWRDLDDPEAGGSELHAHRISQLWAANGLDVVMRTSTAAGHRRFAERDGYRVVRKAGRYAVFPRSALSGFIGRDGGRDALVEIWNGMPFLSPLWARCPRVVFLHHVHAEMWEMALPPNLARLGRTVERVVAPPFYKRSRIVTLSSSSKDEIVEMLKIPSEQIKVVPPGVDLKFKPGPAGICEDIDPLVVAVGRLVPVKRFDLMVDELVRIHKRHATLKAVIVGEGYERPALEEQIRRAGAQDWISLPGRVSAEELVSLYRRAWLVASTSLREGWGMTLTEAAACGTPAVATRIAGHIDAVVDGMSGFLVDTEREFRAMTEKVISDRELRGRLAEGAHRRGQALTWESTAAATLEELVADAQGRLGRGL